jgi:hypothetical protein
MKPLKLTGNDVQLIITALNQTIDQWLKWTGADTLPDGFDIDEGINVVRELADLQYRLEDYQMALEEQVELEDDFPDNVIKFKKDE